MKNQIMIRLEKIHFKLFGHEMSEQMKLFIVNLSWSVLSGVIVLFFTVMVMTLAGRFMGPTEYGRLNLLLLISQFLVIFIFFGLDITIVRSIAKAKSQKDIQRTISSTFYCIVFFLLVLLMISLIFGKKLGGFVGLSFQFILSLVFYTIVVSIKAFFDATIRGLGKFKIQARAKVLEIVIVVLSFVILFIFFHASSYFAYVAVIVSGGLFISIYYYSFIQSYLKDFSFKVLRTHLSASRFFMFSALLATIFLSLDRIIVVRYIDLRTLGIYSAYYAASFSLAAALSQLFINVFFPMTANLEDKSFFRKIDRLFVVGLIPFYVVICLLIVTALSIFGKDYPLRFDYVALFSLVSVLYFFQSLYNTIILDFSQKAYKRYFFLSNSINLVTVIYYFLIIKFVEISIVLILVGLILNLICIIYLQRRMIITSCANNLKKDIPSVSIIE